MNTKRAALLLCIRHPGLVCYRCLPVAERLWDLNHSNQPLLEHHTVRLDGATIHKWSGTVDSDHQIQGGNAPMPFISIGSKW